MTSKRTDSDSTDRRDGSRSFARDDRAIEGLPIRLVIALVVGVAALAIMLNMLGGIGSVGDTEVTVKIADDDQVIEADATGSSAEVNAYAIDENGNNVSDATIVATADSAQLDGVLDESTGDDNHAALDFDGSQSLRADQDMGAIQLEVIPPSDSNYIDEQPNPDIRVVSR
ncbi:hypothetical protein [Natrinema versiforme]|uniref:DUF7382 domain-containing protein n=1 Tax=Natrinema versiforme TaxID=88724 RepID=A0A4V1FZI5_9EURY|nr:hypothetical protein [Natrinema versiforme]QCS41966.1 hypothetical protein FEJ81_06195 [Natrinema versiforme]